MKKSIETLRKEYGDCALDEKELDPNPIVQFISWLNEALKAKVMEPNGMILATCSPLGHPATRTVLLKEVDRGSFVFYTQYSSRKAEHLEHSPFVSLTFWWKELYRQVNLEGSVRKIGRRKSVAYFNQRPRGARLATLSSSQSEPLATRDRLEGRYRELQKIYRGKKIPCPQDWGGYCVQPERVEFWQGRKNRLHDRFLYVKTPRKWILTRLSP